MFNRFRIGLLVVLIVGLVLLIGISVKDAREKNQQIRNECQPTELYFIGNKGRRDRIYDCSGVELND